LEAWRNILGKQHISHSILFQNHIVGAGQCYVEHKHYEFHSPTKSTNRLFGSRMQHDLILGCIFSFWISFSHLQQPRIWKFITSRYKGGGNILPEKRPHGNWGTNSPSLRRGVGSPRQCPPLNMWIFFQIVIFLGQSVEKVTSGITWNSRRRFKV